MTVATMEKNEIVWEEIGYVANAFVFVLAGVIFWRIMASGGKYDLGTHFGFGIDAIPLFVYLIRSRCSMHESTLCF